MARYALTVEYDGSAFAGFERQRDQRTVQGVLERALAEIACHPVAVTCAGRTDAGVHAIGQVVHFDSEAVRPPRAWTLGTNARLPADVSVRAVHAVPDDFHARFSATGRAYRYFIYVRRTRAPLLHARALWRRAPLDVAAMRAGARYLVGEHDFSAFRAAGCQARNPVRHVRALDVTGHAPDGETRCVEVAVRANAFLQHMVRNIVGVLLAIGAGDASPEWAAEVLAGRDRTRGGVTVPACGLCFLHAEYPARFALDAADAPGLLARPHAEVRAASRETG